jgi:DNA ligase (NAD+)
VKKVKSFAHFTSRDAMNIDGLSEATLEKLIGIGAVHEPADLFCLKNHRDQIVEMEGFGEKSYENLVQAAEKARHTTLSRLVYAMGIANIGPANAKMICRAFDQDLERIMTATREELAAVDGIGPVIADAFAAYFESEQNREAWNHVLAQVEIEREAQSRDSSLAGMTFVITGSLNHFENRDQLKARIEDLGGKVTGSVTGKTSYLINNDIASNSGKNQKAKALGVPILSEEEFLSQFMGQSEQNG